MTVLLLFVGQWMRANVRSHSFLAYSSRSPEVFPVFHRETLYHFNRKKLLASCSCARSKNEKRSRAIRTEKVLSAHLSLFIARNTCNMCYPSYESMSMRTFIPCELPGRTASPVPAHTNRYQGWDEPREGAPPHQWPV